MVRLFIAETPAGIVIGPAFEPLKIKLEDEEVANVPEPDVVPLIVNVFPDTANVPAVKVSTPFTVTFPPILTPPALFTVRLFSTDDVAGISKPVK